MYKRKPTWITHKLGWVNFATQCQWQSFKSSRTRNLVVDACFGSQSHTQMSSPGRSGNDVACCLQEILISMLLACCSLA